MLVNVYELVTQDNNNTNATPRMNATNNVNTNSSNNIGNNILVARNYITEQLRLLKMNMDQVENLLRINTFLIEDKGNPLST